VILTAWKAEIGRMVRTGKCFARPNLKITRTKWTGEVAQLVEHLLCKLWTPAFKAQSHQKRLKEGLFPSCAQTPTQGYLDKQELGKRDSTTVKLNKVPSISLLEMEK
jgi:hypothetical protein